MKLKVLILAIFVTVTSCRNKTTPIVDYSEEKLDVATSIYPENISKVFDAHGGLDAWNTMKSLEFTMKKTNGDEITTTDLKNRSSLIEMPKHIIGFNGEDLWLKNKDTTKYKGKPRFYYNLMFYFYAMPFIIADDGIIYDDVEPLMFEGKSYPGIKISYESGVGESPEDEYIVYYNPETYKMEWLAYTVTFFSKEKSSELHFRKYSEWQDVNGLLLPKTMVSFKSENNLPTAERRKTDFTDIKISTEKPDQEIFEAPKEAIAID